MAPNYDKCILNLLSSILKVYDYDSEFPPLPAVDLNGCKSAGNVILLIIDGLGQNYVESRLPYLQSKSIDSISTVFPATTASAILSYYTGIAPNQHACTGWFTYLPEIRTVSTILPFTRRGSQRLLTDEGVETADIFPKDGYLFDKIQGVEKHVVTPANLKGNPVAQLTARDAKLNFYDNTQHMFLTIKELIRTEKRKFIFAYFSEFDSVCHKSGVNSQEALSCIMDVSDRLMAFEPELISSNTRMFICSDHGFLDTTADQVVFLHEHPELKRCLQLPLAGDSRVKNCQVKKEFVNKFLTYLETNLADKCEVFSRDEILEKNFYGPLENSPSLLERIGDYILIMKDAHVLLDYVPGEDFGHFNIGNHSGISEAEMIVPLIQLGV